MTDNSNGASAGDFQLWKDEAYKTLGGHSFIGASKVHAKRVIAVIGVNDDLKAELAQAKEELSLTKAKLWVANDSALRTYDGMAQKADKYDEMKAQCKELVEGLEFYAEKFNWRTNSGKIGITPLTDGRDSEIIDGQWTNGKLARSILSKYKDSVGG